MMIQQQDIFKKAVLFAPMYPTNIDKKSFLMKRMFSCHLIKTIRLFLKLKVCVWLIFLNKEEQK